MSELKGKRLLLLGGHSLMRHVIEKARELGVYTIVTDYYPAEKSPSKAIADEAYDVSTTDVDAIVKLAQDVHADGIFTGYVDVNLLPCSLACERLGLPFYATPDQIEHTINKRKFKEMCRKHGIRVAEDIPKEIYTEKPEEINFPIIIKPADSYSSKGISVCYEPKDIAPCIEHALDFSSAKEVVVDRYIYGDDVYLYFTVKDGVLSLSAMADRALNDEQKGYAPQPVGYSFPSKYIDKYYSEVHDKLQNMVSDLGLKNATFFLQGFVENDSLIFFEMGLRLTGGAGYVQIRNQNEIDQVEMHITYALTGKFGKWDLLKYDNPRFKKPAFVLVVLLKEGKVAKINGLDEIKAMPETIDIVQFIKEGAVNTGKGTLNQVMARIYLYSDTKEKLDEAITKVKNTIEVIDDNGENMILNMN